MALESSKWTLSESTRVISDKDLGYSDVLNKVWWDEVIANSDLLLNSPVVSIDTSGDDVMVIDAQDRKHFGRQVIITVSIGVLQAGIIDFNPVLPSSTVAAYNGIGIDKGMKVALQFESSWWETENQELGWLVTEGLAGVCWVPSNYKADSVSHILMCYPMGKNSEVLAQIGADAGGGAAGDSAILGAVLRDLDKIFPKALNQASKNFLEGLVQDWGNSPYVLGVYSYPKLETALSSEYNKRRHLKIPLADNRIFFAGEATHETHPATVVGALHEGERVAKEVHSKNGSPNKPPILSYSGIDIHEYSASTCKAVDPSVGNQLQSRESGLTNIKTHGNISIICPIDFDTNRETSYECTDPCCPPSEFSDDTICAQDLKTAQRIKATKVSSFILRAANLDLNSYTLICQLNEYLGKTVSESLSNQVNLSNNEIGAIRWSNWRTGDDLANYSIACELPPQTSIISIETRAVY